MSPFFFGLGIPQKTPFQKKSVSRCFKDVTFQFGRKPTHNFVHWSTWGLLFTIAVFDSSTCWKIVVSDAFLPFKMRQFWRWNSEPWSKRDFPWPFGERISKFMGHDPYVGLLSTRSILWKYEKHQPETMVKSRECIWIYIDTNIGSIDIWLWC